VLLVSRTLNGDDVTTPFAWNRPDAAAALGTPETGNNPRALAIGASQYIKVKPDEEVCLERDMQGC
jgi:hypothetical protein